MNVFIVESARPEELYSNDVSGPIISNLLTTMKFRNQYRVATNRVLFGKAISDAAVVNFDVLHVCCHGSNEGISLGDDDFYAGKNSLPSL